MIHIASIGNGDTQYENTRHNVGYMAIDMLKKALEYQDFQCIKNFEYDKFSKSDISILKHQSGLEISLQKTKTYMNTSGELVKKYIEKRDIDTIVLVHDDLDLPIGEYKIQKGKSPHGHNGVISVENALGTKDFWRIRIGIENRGGRNIPGEDYVLQKFSKEENEILDFTLVKMSEDFLKTTEIFQALN